MGATRKRDVVLTLSIVRSGRRRVSISLLVEVWLEDLLILLAIGKSGSAIPNMTFLTRNFAPLTPITPKFPNFSVQILLFRVKHCSHRHTCTCATKFLHHLGTGCYLPKTTFRTKIGGGCARGTSRNLGPPTYFCNRWSEEFGTQLGFGTGLPKNDV